MSELDMPKRNGFVSSKTMMDDILKALWKMIEETERKEKELLDKTVSIV